MKKVKLILVDGPMGAGKTTVAQLLHKNLKYSALISLDPLKRLYSEFKSGDKKSLEIASDVGSAMAKTYLDKGINVIVEKAFTDRKFLTQFIKSSKTKNAKVYVYQIEAPLETRIERIKKRSIAKPKYKKPTLKRINKNHENYKTLRYENAIIFDSSKLTPRKIIKEILKEVKNNF